MPKNTVKLEPFTAPRAKFTPNSTGFNYLGLPEGVAYDSSSANTRTELELAADAAKENIAAFNTATLIDDTSTADLWEQHREILNAEITRINSDYQSHAHERAITSNDPDQQAISQRQQALEEAYYKFYNDFNAERSYELKLRNLHNCLTDYSYKLDSNVIEYIAAESTHGNLDKDTLTNILQKNLGPIFSTNNMGSHSKASESDDSPLITVATNDIYTELTKHDNAIQTLANDTKLCLNVLEEQHKKQRKQYQQNLLSYYGNWLIKQIFARAKAGIGKISGGAGASANKLNAEDVLPKIDSEGQWDFDIVPGTRASQHVQIVRDPKTQQTYAKPISKTEARNLDTTEYIELPDATFLIPKKTESGKVNEKEMMLGFDKALLALWAEYEEKQTLPNEREISLYNFSQKNKVNKAVFEHAFKRATSLGLSVTECPGKSFKDLEKQNALAQNAHSKQFAEALQSEEQFQRLDERVKKRQQKQLDREDAKKRRKKQRDEMEAHLVTTRQGNSSQYVSDDEYCSDEESDSESFQQVPATNNNMNFDIRGDEVPNSDSESENSFSATDSYDSDLDDFSDTSTSNSDPDDSEPDEKDPLIQPDSRHNDNDSEDEVFAPQYSEQDYQKLASHRPDHRQQEREERRSRHNKKNKKPKKQKNPSALAGKQDPSKEDLWLPKVVRKR